MFTGIITDVGKVTAVERRLLVWRPVAAETRTQG